MNGRYGRILKERSGNRGKLGEERKKRKLVKRRRNWKIHWGKLKEGSGIA